MNKVPGLNSNVFFDPVGLPFSQVSSEVPFPSGAIAYYRMDESSGAVIDAVNGYNGVNNGATPNVTGKINTAYSFDGLVDYIDISSIISTISDNATGTWSFWIKPTAAIPSNEEAMVSFYSDTTQSIRVRIQTDGKIIATASNGAELKWNLRTDSSLLTDNTWAHIAVTFGVVPEIYVNGVSVAQTFTNETDKTFYFNSTTIIDSANISGVSFNEGTLQNLYNGKFDELGFWDRALSATEISNLYNGGNGKSLPIGFPPNALAYYRLDEASGAVIDAVNGYNGVNNGATPNVTGKINTAYEFDGLVDYVNLDALVTPLATTTQGTWSCWVKPVDATPLAGQQILTFGDTSATEFMILSINAIPTLQMHLNKAGVNQWQLRADVNPFSDNTWSMITIVQDGISPILYVNGVAVAQTFSISTDKTAWFNDLTGLDNGRLGDINYGGFGEVNFFDGTIDELGIWTRPLGQAEITALYNNGAGRQI